MAHQGIFTVVATDNTNTPNICIEAYIAVIAHSATNAADKAYTIVQQWRKATGIPVTMDGYSVLEVNNTDEGNKEYKLHLYVI